MKSLFSEYLSMRYRSSVVSMLMFGVLTLAGCGKPSDAAVKTAHAATDSAAADSHNNHGSTAEADSVKDDPKYPPDAAHAPQRLQASPRHAEYAMIPISARDSIRAWVVYPERSKPAPVVIVVHEIFGLTTWVRAVADQLASEGFIAIAPDMLSRQKLPGSADSMAYQDQYRKAVSGLPPKEVQSYLTAIAKYGTALPAASKKYGIVGFCWGGGVSFNHAAQAPALSASVVYYGTSPDLTSLTSSIKAPVLGLYAGNDARVNTTIPPADSVMKALRKTFEHYIYDGAGHGFLRQQAGAEGANLNATKQAWPATIAWFRRYLE